MTDGTQSLRDFRSRHDETAFNDLVRRYSNLVISTARRRVNAPQLIDDIAQTVFLRLAQSPPEARTEAELLGWFHRTTVNAAIDAWRSQSRREAREQSIATMETTEPNDPSTAWDQLAPALDDALNALPTNDREAILLRYFQDKPMRDIGQSLGVSEDAAKMRVSRALERLRTLLVSRGVACTAAALGQSLDDHALDTGGIVPTPSLTGASKVARSSPLSTTPGSQTNPSGSWLSDLTSVLLQSPWGMTAAVVIAVCVGIGGSFHFLNRASRNAEPSSGNRSRRHELAAVQSVRPTSALRSARPTQPGSTAVSPVDDAALADAELALRALLTQPATARQYPPRPLVDVLAQFGDQIGRAVPILVEAVQSPDYETRAWALSGLSRALGILRQAAGFQGPFDTLSQALSNSIPTLSEVILNPNSPGLLRTVALTALLPSTVWVNGTRTTPSHFPPEAQAIVLQALRMPVSPSDDFRYEIADAVTRSLTSDDAAWPTLAKAMRDQLQDADLAGRSIAAFALATWPVDKPEGVKEVLLEFLRSNATHSYRAAFALCHLGPSAVDVVPELLAFSAAHYGGVARHAREAACRLQPSLRAQYPDIDATLRAEEEAEASRSGVLPHRSIGEWAVAEFRSGHMDRLSLSFLHAEDPEASRRDLLSQLESEWATAPDSLREDLGKAIELIRKAALPTDADPGTPRTLALNNLTITARVLAIDNPSMNEVKISEAMERFETHGAAGPMVTPETFEQVSKALIAIDPSFEKAWRTQVRKEYPWLDRSIPGL